MLFYILENLPVAPWRKSLSAVAGSSSLACWIVLLLPQLIEQWRLQSAEGISLYFLITWLVADVANLIGSVWARLLPEVILLAVWYCIADGLVLLSYAYYTYKAKHHAELLAQRSNSEGDPTQPLLDRRNSARSRRKSSISGSDPISWLISSQSSKATRLLFQVGLPVVFVFGAGFLGYLFSDTEDAGSGDENSGASNALGPQIFGYISAVLYLGARIPQIIQNHRRKSVEGLSLLFFIFSTLGNLTYSAQIIIYRSDYEWLKTNFPWILGSFGTIFEDAIIFMQFHVYAKDESEEVATV